MNRRIRAIYTIESRPTGPARAREVVARELSNRVTPETLDDLKLMVSELVTHGILYGRAGPQGRLALDLLINGTVRCSVSEHGAASAGTLASGWRKSLGLRVVERLASRWGIRRTPDATEVWFETDPATVSA